MGHNTPLKYRFKKAWHWPKDVEDFIREKSRGRILHVCCGQSTFGDVRVDAFVQGPGIITKDIIDCKFDEEFDTVIADPPWAMDYRDRPKFLQSCRDALRPGGIYILNAPWLPLYSGLELVECWIRIPSPRWHNAILIGISRKVQGKLKI